jgi:hypothetical protein
VRIVTRADLVGEFVGHTAPKCLKVLNECLGGVLIIDEAYSLYHGDKDSFGFEAITIINEFVSKHPNEIILILIGYQDKLAETLFAGQPGLERRCTWYIDVEEYTS